MQVRGGGREEREGRGEGGEGGEGGVERRLGFLSGI